MNPQNEHDAARKQVQPVLDSAAATATVKKIADSEVVRALERETEAMRPLEQAMKAVQPDLQRALDAVRPLERAMKAVQPDLDRAVKMLDRALQPFQEFEAAAFKTLSAAINAATVEAARIEFLGKKSGRIKELQDLLGKATPEQRPAFGAKFNEVRQRVTAALEARQQELAKPKVSLTGIDISLPGESVRREVKCRSPSTRLSVSRVPVAELPELW